MTNATTFRNTIIKPVLTKMALSLFEDAAEELLLGTAIQESMNFKYRRQIGGGPAVGYYQMEPATHDDIWNNYLKYRKKLANHASYFLKSANKHLELEWNDKYATAMARIHYWRVPAPLPAKGDLVAQANYWKKYYNTPLGKGLPKEYIHKWKLYVLKDNQ